MHNNTFCCINSKMFESMSERKSKNLLFFSPAESSYVREHYPLGCTKEIATYLGRPIRSIMSHAFQIGVKKLAQAPRKSIYLSDEIREVISLIYAEMSNRDICQFLGVSRALLTKHASSVGLKKDAAWRDDQLRRVGRELPERVKFQRGHKAWNEGISDPSHPYHKRGLFKSGRHHSEKSDGSFVVRRYAAGSGEKVGYLYVKLGPRNWKSMGAAMWEEYQQTQLPAGYVVVFKNGDRLDFAKENLLAMPMGDVGLCRAVYGAPFEMLPLVKKHAEIARAISDRSRKTAV